MNKTHIVLLLMATLFAACKVTERIGDNRHIYVQREGREAKNWKLVWHDEFDEAALDTSKWSRITPGTSDWNRHMSVDDQLFRFDNGQLYLLGINNPDTSIDHRPYLTGGIRSKGKFAFQYGRVEIRAKLENAQGAWPALWMLAEQNRYGAYPRIGEIEIMEHLNHDTIIYQTTHSHYTLNLKQTDHPPHSGIAPLPGDGYHVFGISWYPDRIVFQLDGQDTFTYPRVAGVDPSQWPYDQPFYLLIDQQLGGSWVGEVDPAQLPVQLIVDWVRIYQ